MKENIYKHISQNYLKKLYEKKVTPRLMQIKLSPIVYTCL